MRGHLVTWVEYPRRRRRKRLAKKIARQGGYRRKRLNTLVSYRADVVGRLTGAVFYTDLP